MSDLLAPFPWFGGKRDVAPIVWRAFGDVPNFIEPFFGSGAVLLNRPQPFDGIETINDADGFVANFWRAVRSDPDAVAVFADNPVFENDLHARHIWLVERKDELRPKLEADHEWYDAKIAGWWCWGICCWIGSGFCSGDGPWRVADVDGERQLVHLGNAGMGVNRQLVHLSDAGMGVNRKRVASGIAEWMHALSERLQRVRVCCGDWTRVCGGRSGDSLKHFFASGNRCAVFLDPPYSAEADRNETIYRCEDLNVAHAVREWAIRHGDDERLRIALCGYDGEHAMPDNWRCHQWKARGGYASIADGDSQGKANAHREVIWFSPHCERIDQERQADLFAESAA